MGVSDSLAAALKRQLLTSFPSSKIPMASELAAVGMNPLVARFLTTLLERHIVEETNRISYDPSEWLPAEKRSVVDRSIRETKQIIRQSITFPASRWEYFLGLASDQVCRYLVSPIDTIFGYAFPGDADSASSSTVLKRLRSFAAYTDILDPVIASLPADPDAIIPRMEFRYKLDEIARDVGHSITEWDSFAEPLFSLHEEVNGTRVVPTTRLASLAFSLWRQDVSDKIDTLTEATGDSDVSEEILVDIMKESFEPPTPRRRATIVDADQVPVALDFPQETDASDTVPDEAPVAAGDETGYMPEESLPTSREDLPPTTEIRYDESAAINALDSGFDDEDAEHAEVAAADVQDQPEPDDLPNAHDVNVQDDDSTVSDDDYVPDLASNFEREPATEPPALFDDLPELDKTENEWEVSNRSVDQIEEAVDAALALENAEQGIEFSADPEFALPDREQLSRPESSSPGDSRWSSDDDLHPRAEQSSAPSDPNRPTKQDSILSERLTATPRRPPGESAGSGPVPLWKQFHKKLNAPMTPDRPDTVHSRNKPSSDQPTVADTAADSLHTKTTNKSGSETKDASSHEEPKKGDDLAHNVASDIPPTEVQDVLHNRIPDHHGAAAQSVNTGAHAAEPSHTTDELEGTEESVKPLWLRYQKKVDKPPQKPDRPAEDLSEIERRVFGRTDMERRNRFTNELFDGSEHSYIDVLTQIDAAKEWSRASHIIAHSVFRRYRINIYSDVAVTFTNAVEQRYLQ